ncbi:paraquat-inducible protein A [Pseudomonas sp. ZM23]|uniref:Paraquat-inducible protein A n=1 Tax=Pseudomonas triclosanedens TaxID=2961893 RepID=A0ABY6ZY32_9PSED|nr:paraquat-inducible protein A [Pseudomonas triclosanedens]MCP8467868.1 paraquat-inducible protein A [Pseudomonas triclosanedens]MCP8473840.1 paraquat-inducible protein A [Pseudomonas triclosanedens]MCP8479834.1 paraquat-inducible protein A [Pseudomonas triclosanedens]WAI48774.1 paraquat-inducible protein A [Pseudomonas triclosanedens]
MSDNQGQTLEHLPLDELTACHECDLLMRRETVPLGQRSVCPRCGYELEIHRPYMVRRALALVLTALVLYIPANFMPIMHITILGQVSTDTVWSGVQGLYNSSMKGVGVLVFLCSMVIPLAKLLCQLFVLITLRFRVFRPQGMLLFRGYQHLREWGMLEVYLMGILVSIVKLIGMAELHVGLGLACFVALLLTQIWLEVTMSHHQVWGELSGEFDHASH